MRRLVLGGLAGIALLFTGSLLVLDRLTSDPGAPSRWRGGAGPAGEPTAPVVAVGKPPPPGLQGAMDSLRGVGPGGAADLPVVRDPPKPAPPPDSWEAVPVLTRSTRGKDKDPVTGALTQELNDLHDQLATCFDPAVAAREGSQAPLRTQDEVTDQGDTIVLVLQLELSPGAVRVVEAPAAAVGGFGEETVACAQRMLRGKVFEAPGARATGRRRMHYSLIP